MPHTETRLDVGIFRNGKEIFVLAHINMKDVRDIDLCVLGELEAITTIQTSSFESGDDGGVFDSLMENPAIRDVLKKIADLRLAGDEAWPCSSDFSSASEQILFEQISGDEARIRVLEMILEEIEREAAS